MIKTQFYIHNARVLRVCLLSKYYYNMSSVMSETINQGKFDKIICGKFSTYIPRKNLIFIDHPKHGRVYPVYIADENYYKKYSPKVLYIPALFFTGLNIFLILTGFQFIPMNKIYEFFYFNDMVFLASIILNYLTFKKFFKYLSTYTNRVKAMYLFPSGNRIVVETFDGTVSKFDNLDIFENNIKSQYNELSNKTLKWFNPFLVNNENSFQAHIRWGRNMEYFFNGKRLYLDYEIFGYIVSRFNIDTTVKQFRKQIPLGYYTTEEKKKILKYFQSHPYRKTKINHMRLSYHYKLLWKKYVEKKKEKIIQKELKLY